MIQNSSPHSRQTPSATLSEVLPGRILLHVCCAPCSGVIIETLLQEKFLPSLFFYNPNIVPFQEYELRKRSVIAFAQRVGIPFVDADYDHEAWLERVKGLEDERERGQRCSVCFNMRLERSALYAFENKFSVFTTTNGMSPRKDMNQVNDSGLRAASRYPGLTFWARNWRLNGAVERSMGISKKEGFYKQLYCGCPFSLKIANQNRAARNLPPIEQGTSPEPTHS
ncbi:MAG: epoxyqueuosine reductase QueH [Candidatus Omnitrophica bacterium]|nr:epoxyqueuosine reductase QueH [Candidatus Omnitrophota bacterium]